MVLKLVNGGLIYERLNIKTDPKNPAIKKIAESEFPDIKVSQAIPFIKRGHNIANPIPYTTLSNMLISLAGGIPVPTKPNKRKFFPEEIKRDVRFDEMAKNSFYKLTSPIDPDCVFVKQVVGEDGEYYGIVSHAMNNCGGEFMQSEKPAINSNRACSTVLFARNDGEIEEVKGCYDFGMLKRLFNDNENHPGYRRMISFISKELGVDDVTKTHTFAEMAHEFYNKSNEVGYFDRVGKFFEEMQPMWDDGGVQGRWFYAIFHYGKKNGTDNTSINDKGSMTKTFLTNRRGDKVFRIPVNGEIIIPITDESVYNAILSGKGYCTFLDGGIATIAMFCDGEYDAPNPYFRTEWKKISDNDLTESVHS